MNNQKFHKSICLCNNKTLPNTKKKYKRDEAFKKTRKIEQVQFQHDVETSISKCEDQKLKGKN